MSKPSTPSRKLRELSNILLAVANPYRIMILELLEKQSRRYGEIAASLGVTQAALAHHLKKLEAAKLVEHKNEVYIITSLGKKILSLLQNLDLAKVQEAQVVTPYGFSIPFKDYLDLIFLKSSFSQACRKKLEGLISREIRELESNYDSIPQEILDVMIEALAVKNGCQGRVSNRLFGDKGYPLTDQALEFLTASGIYDLVRGNYILFDSGVGKGVSSVFLPSINEKQLKSLLKNSELFPEIVLQLNAGGEIDAGRLLDAFLVADQKTSVTLLLDVADNGEFACKILSLLEAHLPLRNILLALQGWERIPDDALLPLTRLLNNGLQALFVASDMVPSGRLLAYPPDSMPLLHLGAITFLAPFIYDRERIVVNPMDFISDTLLVIERNIPAIKKLTLKATRILELEEAQDLSYIFQIGFAGLEAGLLFHLPGVREAFEEFQRYKRLLVNYAFDILSNLSIGEIDGEIKIVSTLFTPSQFLNILVSLHYRQNMHVNVNSLSPFSLNREIRTAEQAVELESALQTPLKDPRSILEVRVTSLSAARLKEILAQMQNKGIKQFTITLTGLHACNICGTIISSRISRCPKCYSRDLSSLVKPQLFYVKREDLDTWTLEEVDRRVIMAAPLSFQV